MEFFHFFDGLYCFNATILIFSLYLLVSITVGVSYSSDVTLAYPTLLKPFSAFSTFIIAASIYLFCLNFDQTDNILLYNQIFQFLFLTICVLVLNSSKDFLANKNITKFEYDLLFIFFIISSLILCFANDFLYFYLAVEMQSLCFYVLASFQRNSEFSTEAGLKYFVFGAVISGILLLGLSLIYISFGTLNFDSIYSLAHENIFLFLGILFLFITFLFKVGAVPFHSWLPDVYDGSILSVTFLFSAAPKIIVFSVFVKVFFLVLGDFSDIWIPLTVSCSFFSIVIGSFYALYQKRMKKLFAFSTIAHTGFIMLGLCSFSPEGGKSLITYLIIYSVLSILTFSILIYISSSNSKFPYYLANFTSFGVKNTNMAICFSLLLLSIAGIPPLAGFFSKFYVLYAFVSQGYIILTVLTVIISSIACFYYIRLIKTFFFTKESKNSFWVSSASRRNTEVAIGTTMVINLLFFIFPGLITAIADTLILLLV